MNTFLTEDDKAIIRLLDLCHLQFRSPREWALVCDVMEIAYSRLPKAMRSIRDDWYEVHRDIDPFKTKLRNHEWRVRAGGKDLLGSGYCVEDHPYLFGMGDLTWALILDLVLIKHDFTAKVADIKIMQWAAYCLQDLQNTPGQVGEVARHIESQFVNDLKAELQPRRDAERRPTASPPQNTGCLVSIFVGSAIGACAMIVRNCCL